MGVDAAVVLAGGGGRRLGGSAKPTLPVGGRPMLARVLAAVAAARVRVVVGPPELAVLVPGGVLLVCEEPPGEGPVAALAAGLASAAGGLAAGSRSVADGLVVVLAADLPLLDPVAVDHLTGALGSHDGAVYVDSTGRRQWLCGVWHVAALRARLTALGGTGPLAGRSVRELLGPLRVAEVAAPADRPPPWYDCDTPAALAEARRWTEAGG